MIFVIYLTRGTPIQSWRRVGTPIQSRGGNRFLSKIKFKHKKVLHERKRHTARRIASGGTPSSLDRGGLPPSSPNWGVPPSSPDGGGGLAKSSPNGRVPPFSPDWGVPPCSPDRGGYPIESWGGGVSHIQSQWRVPPCSPEGGTHQSAGLGTPPPKCEQTDTCENSTFPCTSYPGANNSDSYIFDSNFQSYETRWTTCTSGRGLFFSALILWLFQKE